MQFILHGYDVNPATWLYLSLMLMIAVFFRFTRVWSLRNLDLALLWLLSPGVLLVRDADPSLHPAGYVWLFVVSGLLLVRLFCDPLFTRRPTLEQNLNAAGSGFLCVCAFWFLMAVMVTKPLPAQTEETIRRGRELYDRSGETLAEAAATNDGGNELAGDAGEQAGPATSLIAAPVGALSQTVTIAARAMAVLAHAAVVVGLIVLGARHFGQMQLGLAMALLYLLLPCTSYDVGKINHVLPAALIVWAFVAYRRPVVAGSLMGLACGALIFPVFLLPLWTVYYGRRGGVRFAASVGVVWLVLIAVLALQPGMSLSLAERILGSMNWKALQFHGGHADGFWGAHSAAYRLPVMAGYAIMLVLLTVIPRRKNLEHLTSHSTALIVGAQFWYPQQGGVYVLWYLPLLLLVVFRPRLTHLPPPAVAKEKTADETRGVSPPRPQLTRTSAATRLR